MAMANVNVVADILNEDVNLEVVKQQIALQESNYGLRNCGVALHKWVVPNEKIEGGKSNSFTISNGVYTCDMSLNRTVDTGIWFLFLKIRRMEKYSLKPEKDKYHSFQHFVCHFEYLDRDEHVRHGFATSINAFLSSARKNEIDFRIDFLNEPVSDVTMEIYVEPSTSSNYTSPLDNAVVGKIGNLMKKRSLVFENREMVVSSKFEFGSADQKMIVQFWRSKVSEESVSLTLHVINRKRRQLGPPFDLRVVVTFFSQRQNERHLVKEIHLARENRICLYPLLSISNETLKSRGCLDNDTLYYRVVVKPHAEK